MSVDSPSLDNALRLLAKANAEIAAVRKRENEAPPEHVDMEAAYFLWQNALGVANGEIAKRLGLSAHAGEARYRRARKMIDEWLKSR